jgi:hypothetical protein
MVIDPAVYSLMDRLRSELYGSRRIRGVTLTGGEPVELLRRVNERRLTQPIDTNLLLQYLRLLGRHTHRSVSASIDYYERASTCMEVDCETARIPASFAADAYLSALLLDADDDVPIVMQPTDKSACDEPMLADGHINDRGNIVDIFV